MSKLEKLITQLRLGKRLSHQEVRKLLTGLGYELVRQKGSHEQWVKSGSTFTLACHSKDVPNYVLDTLKGLVGENEKK